MNFPLWPSTPSFDQGPSGLCGPNIWKLTYSQFSPCSPCAGTRLSPNRPYPIKYMTLQLCDWFRKARWQHMSMKRCLPDVTCARQGRGHQIARNPCPALHHHVLQTWCPLPSLGDLVAPQTKRTTWVWGQGGENQITHIVRIDERNFWLLWSPTAPQCIQLANQSNAAERPRSTALFMAQLCVCNLGQGAEWATFLVR